MEMGPGLHLMAPAYESLVASKSIGVAGTRPWAVAVEASGVEAALAGGDFAAQVPLAKGQKAVVVAARTSAQTRRGAVGWSSATR